MENNLKNLFINHDGKISDKWSLYINEWDAIFSPFQNRDVNLLEIGIQNGGSLEIFAKYFPKAKHIIGCDIETACQTLEFEDPRISVTTGDINSDEVEKRIAELAPHLDIIIDDGSHRSSDIIHSFSRYFKKLDDHGLYLIEDLHTSYWDDYEGGLFKPYTAMAFLKRLVDITNFEHWQSNQSRKAYLAPFMRHYDLDFDEFDFYQIHSIVFINSLCVIQKRPPEDNTLGRRMVVGSAETVSEDYVKFDGTSIHDMPKSAVDDSHLDVFSLVDRTQQLAGEVSDREQRIQQLSDTLTEREGSLQTLQAEIDHKAHSIQQFKAEIQAQVQALKLVQAELAQREQALTQLKAELDERGLAIEKMNAIITKQSHKIQYQERSFEQQNESIHQLQNEIAAGIQQIHENNLQIQTLEQELSALEQEILFYTLSKSWRFTRPFRKIMGFLRGNRHV
jgi:hypothetical protein